MRFLLDNTVQVTLGRLKYSMNFYSKYIILDDLSGTGKSTLIDILSEEGTVISGRMKFQQIQQKDVSETWEEYFQKNNPSEEKVFFSDEGWSFFFHSDFQAAVHHTNAHFLLVTRDVLKGIPYAINEVCKVVRRDAINYIEPLIKSLFLLPKLREDMTLFTEDTGSGFKFFKNRFLRVETLRNKDLTIKHLQNKENICCLVDSLGFGSNLKDAIKITESTENELCFIPSFEGLILVSDLLGQELSYSSIEANKEEWCYNRLIELTDEVGHKYSKSGKNMCFTQDCCYMPVSKQCILYKEGDKYKLILGDEWLKQFSYAFGEKLDNKKTVG